MRSNRAIYAVYALIVLIGVPGWELAARATPRVRLLVSSPMRVYEFIGENAEELLHATWVTWVEASLGLVVAAIASLALSIATFYRPRLLHFILPGMVTSQVVPLIVLAPFFVIALGIGILSKVAMAAVLCFFPTFVGFAQGYKLIPQEVHDFLDVYEAPKKLRVFRVYLPLSLPSGLAGLKVSATLSVIGAIVAEFTGSEIGLGRNLFMSTIRLEPELMMASLFGSASLGAVMFLGVHFLERRLGHWYLPSRGE